MKLNGYTGTIVDKDGYLYLNGKTEYKILISKDASISEKYAAEEYSNVGMKNQPEWDDSRNCRDVPL